MKNYAERGFLMPEPVLIKGNLSQVFIDTLEGARQKALHSPDDAVRYMAEHIPIFAQWAPTPEQARAGGCERCVYLGLWADRWPGYANSLHGIIWVFESGIRGQGGNLPEQAYRTLIHEMDHALQRDHVLDSMESKRNSNAVQKAAALAYHPAPRPCCGG
jgi:hypothetical protein